MTAQESGGYKAPAQRAVDTQSGVTERRTAGLRVRLTPDEHARYARFAARTGVSMSELFRLAVESALIQEAIRG